MSNEQNKTEEKTFLQKHGLKIVGGVALIVGSIFIGKKLGQKGMMPVPKGNYLFEVWPDGSTPLSKELGHKIQDLEIPNIISAHVDELWKDGDDVLGIMHDIDFKDLGKFGKEIKEKIPELKDMEFVHFPTIGFTKYNAD